MSILIFFGFDRELLVEDAVVRYVADENIH